MFVVCGSFYPTMAELSSCRKDLWPPKPPDFAIWLFLENVCQSLVRHRQPNPDPHSSKLYSKSLWKMRKWKIPRKQAVLTSWNNTQQKQLIFKDLLMMKRLFWAKYGKQLWELNHWVGFPTPPPTPDMVIEILWTGVQMCKCVQMWLATPAAVASRWLPGDGTGLESSYSNTRRCLSFFWKRQAVTPAPQVCREAMKEGSQLENASRI